MKLQIQHPLYGWGTYLLEELVDLGFYFCYSVLELITFCDKKKEEKFEFGFQLVYPSQRERVGAGPEKTYFILMLQP